MPWKHGGRGAGMKGETPAGCCVSDKAWLSGKLLVPAKALPTK